MSSADSSSSAKPRVFISYAREDLDKAKRLKGELQLAGANPWIDVEDVLPGERWRDDVLRRIERCDVFVALFSSAYSRSDYVRSEVKVALHELETRPRGRISIIPLLLDESDPSDQQLLGTQRISMHPQWGEGLEKLTRALGLNRGYAAGGDRSAAAISGDDSVAGADQDSFTLRVLLPEDLDESGEERVSRLLVRFGKALSDLHEAAGGSGLELIEGQEFVPSITNVESKL
ncbi:MAG: toll/interleukin-1 receptor domain-containing protein [Planctomycetota bacterium]